MAMRLPFGRNIALLALLVLFVAMAVLFLVSAVTINKTLGGRSPPPYSRLPSTGGWPEVTLALTGDLAYDNGVYKLKVEAYPGYVVPLRFTTLDLETWAAAHLGERVIVSGHWDNTQASVFVVDKLELAKMFTG